MTVYLRQPIWSLIQLLWTRKMSPKAHFRHSDESRNPGLMSGSRFPPGRCLDPGFHRGDTRETSFESINYRLVPVAQTGTTGL